MNTVIQLRLTPSHSNIPTLAHLFCFLRPCHPLQTSTQAQLTAKKSAWKSLPTIKNTLKKEGNSLVKLAVTGAAVVGGIVGVYLLYKHFLSKKEKDGKARLRKRDEFKVSDVEEEMKAVYTSALEDEEFLEFLEEIQGSGLFDDV